LKWRGSATLATHPKDAINGNHWKIGQGEIFTGEFNMNQIVTRMPKGRAICAVFNKSNTILPVVVKVSSLAVHRYLVHPDKSFFALDNINSAQLSPETRKALSHVLYAVYKPSIGTITVMADLTKENYKVLRPDMCIDEALPLSKLWEAFATLVETLLLPIAQVGYIHPDLRPGFDVTSNILCQVTNKGKNKQAAMCLIDYESLVSFDAWKPPPSKDFKFIKSNRSWSVETFVWWQCLLVAFAWIEAKRQREMEKEDLKKKVQTSTSWLKQFRGSAKKDNLSAVDVKTFLIQIGELIRDRDTAKSESKSRAAR
jgi:hypothetical protein